MKRRGLFAETIVSIALVANSVQAEPRLEKNVVYGMYSVWRCLWTCTIPTSRMAMAVTDSRQRMARASGLRRHRSQGWCGVL